MIRNLENERPGTRYGSRVVLRSDFIICGQTKYVALWVQCECGSVDLVRKSALVNGKADRCVECQSDEALAGCSGCRLIRRGVVAWATN